MDALFEVKLIKDRDVDSTVYTGDLITFSEIVGEMLMGLDNPVVLVRIGEREEMEEAPLFIIFNDGEHCPHCFNNDHHNSANNKNPHRCEFCNRIDAEGTIEMSLEWHKRAAKAEWKESLMFGRTK